MRRSTYVFSGLALLLIALGVHYFFLREKLEAPATRKYSATPAKSDTQKEKTSASSELQMDSEGELFDEEDGETLSGSDLSDLEGEDADATAGESVFTGGGEEQTGFTEAEIAEVKAEMAAVEKTLAEGEVLLERAQQSLDASIPIVLAHLNKLSPEEQRDFLAQVRNSLYNKLPPEVAALVDEDPEILDEAVEQYLERLFQAGYELPE